MRGVKLKVIEFSENRGLGEALKTAVENCANELIARMDSDDIAVCDRFEKQLVIIIQNEDIDICGGQIVEFIDDTSNVAGRRIVPEINAEIKKYIK